MSKHQTNELVRFCAKHLKDRFDPSLYASALIDETEGTFFEIRGLHTRSGAPATISF